MIWGYHYFWKHPHQNNIQKTKNHGPPPSKVKESFSHPSFRRNKNHHDSNDEQPLDQKSQLIKKKHGFGWLGSCIPLRPKVGDQSSHLFPVAPLVPLWSPQHGHLFGVPRFWGSPSFQRQVTGNDRCWFLDPNISKTYRNLYIQIISHWSATGYYSTRISKTCSEFALS